MASSGVEVLLSGADLLQSNHDKVQVCDVPALQADPAWLSPSVAEKVRVQERSPQPISHSQGYKLKAFPSG